MSKIGDVNQMSKLSSSAGRAKEGVTVIESDFKSSRNGRSPVGMLPLD